MVEKIPGWLERLLLPRLSSLEGELKAFRGEAMGEFRAVHTRIDSLEKELSSLRSEMNGRIESLGKEMNARFNALEGKVTLVEDVTRLKMEIRALAEKVAAIAPS